MKLLVIVMLPYSSGNSKLIDVISFHFGLLSKWLPSIERWMYEGSAFLPNLVLQTFAPRIQLV